MLNVINIKGQDSRAMIVMQIARIVVEFLLFIELTDDDILDPDVAIQTRETLARDLQALDKGFLRELIDVFAAIAPQYSSEAQRLVRNMAYDLYLEEAVAADDPVRLAALQAQRDVEKG